MSDVKIGVIGGSGMAAAMGGDGHRHDVDTPFGKPSDAIVETSWSGVPVFMLSRHGAGHRFNPSNVPYRANIFALKSLGVTHVLATAAVGSLRIEMRPRDLVLVDQLIDKTINRPSTFYEPAAVHVEFAEPFCPMLRQVLADAGKDDFAPAGSDAAGPPDRARLHPRGCYVVMEGPAFSTKAESVMHRLWGGDLIGMTALPEAKLAREAELPYAQVAMVTDYDSWRPPVIPKPGEAPPPPKQDEDALLAEIISNLNAASASGLALLKKAIELIAADPGRIAACPAMQSLKRAIWTDKSAISVEQQQRLAPLWLRYFTGS